MQLTFDQNHSSIKDMPEDIDTKIVKAFLWYIVPIIYLLPAIKLYSWFLYHFNNKWLLRFIFVWNEITQAVFSLYAGMLMYEIHMPLIMLAKLEMESGKLSKVDAKKEFRRAILNLKMSLEMLKYEPEGSFEKNVYHGAEGSLVPLESFISSLW